MPLVETVMSEADLQARIARIQTLMQNNPANGSLRIELKKAQDEYGQAMLAKHGWPGQHTVKVEDDAP